MKTFAHRDAAPLEGLVLNAFRHLGGRHALLDLVQAGDVKVLNAFRHLGGRHPWRQGRRARALRVLNAFRHLGGRHPSAWFDSHNLGGAQRLSASVMKTFRGLRREVLGSLRAQRLSASVMKTSNWFLA